MIRKRILFLGFTLFAFIASAIWANISELAEVLLKAHKKNLPIPILSESYPEPDVETAYQIQKAYVQKILAKDRIAGFKAGLTSEETQKKFGVQFPVAGILFASGKNMNDSVIEKSGFKVLMIETEIGFIVGKPITQPLEDVSELQDSIQSIIPVIELPDLGFEDLKKVKAVDIITSNISAAQFIVGPEKVLNNIDLNKTTVTLILDGQIVNRGKGSDALGDQWKTALWLVNAIVKQGWKIEPGQILITGVLGKMIPGKQGKYIADYGTLGKIFFEVK
ncbi:MAG: fumarylacetoacetate hydrolase family protein [Deltaproteobacteria bacterium]|nr:fumarylacetoacetate hydrolase family protein [Deltaproteobacteria bacterium]